MLESSLFAPLEGGSHPPPLGHLLALAPLYLVNRRQARYVGDDLCFPVQSLVETDQALIKALYSSLSDLLAAMTDKATDDTRKWQEVEAWTERHNLDRIIDDVRELGRATYAANASEELAKAMHDLRGGALSALLGRLQLLRRLSHNESELQTIFVLLRDHLKIMRSALTGLDEPRREADRRPKSHDARLILEKWHDSVLGPNWRERPIRLFIDCRYKGAMTECCLESAAIDRIFYNLANNAARHAAGDRLDMAIFPVPTPPGDCLRFVLSNEVNEQDAAFLLAQKARAADSVDRGINASLLSLFEPAISSTGSGYGLTVVADFVAGAFGLKDRKQALQERYVGAILEGGTFRVWFHWPIANSNLPPKLDDLHQPEQSLSEP